MLKKILSSLFNNQEKEERALALKHKELIILELKGILQKAYESISKMIEEDDLTNPKQVTFAATYSLDLDFDSLTRHDLKCILPELAQLHEIAKKDDSSITIQGLDFLPWVTLSTKNTLSGMLENREQRFNMIIGLDRRQPYNHWVNPFCEEDYNRTLRKKPSAPRAK